MSQKSNKVRIPDTFQDLEKWETNRRSFLRAALVAGAASQIAWFTSCSSQLEEANDHLSAEESTILKGILNVLWPDDGNGPGIEELNTFGYLMWVLGDAYTLQEDKDYFKEGLQWSDDKAMEIHGEHFYDLDQKQQQTLVDQFVGMDWGENWCSVMVTYIMESVVLDPIYGGNKDEAGWNWLEHVPGNPRPSETTRVESFFEKYKPNV